MTTHLWLYDAAGRTDQWPTYTPTDVSLTIATASMLRYVGTISAGDFVGSTFAETYRGRFNYDSGGYPSGRVTSVGVFVDGEAVMGVRFDEPARVRHYQADFADRLTGDVAFHGNNRANAMETTTGADTLSGGAGNDTLSAGTGKDLIYGGKGDDYLLGGAGIDTIVGGAGDDTYVVDRYKDAVREVAGGGNDTVISFLDYRVAANVENVFLYASALRAWGDEARNLLAGNANANELHGLAGNDTLSGGNGTDTLIGGYGHDQLVGGAARDRLTGNAGDDVLDGGRSADWLTGGGGDDTFTFLKVQDSLPNLRDVVSDFTDGDTIDLSDIDARTDDTADDTFRYIGARAFSGDSGELRYAHGLLAGDIDGDRSADFIIRILGAPALSADDLVL